MISLGPANLSDIRHTDVNIITGMEASQKRREKAQRGGYTYGLTHHFNKGRNCGEVTRQKKRGFGLVGVVNVGR